MNCKYCALPESEHHEFTPHWFPNGCECNPGDWLETPDPICGAYRSDGSDDAFCATCFHDLGCHKSLPDDWHADHVVPYVKSKRTNVHEMQPLCPNCNMKKGTK